MQQFEQYPGRPFAIIGEVVMILTFMRLSFKLDEHLKKILLIFFLDSFPLTSLFILSDC